MIKYLQLMLLMLTIGILAETQLLQASSHREAPLIANDPLADNTDLYAFRSPDAPNTITIIANYIPGELAQGGPNYYTFGENIRYEIHIDNNTDTPGDDIIYRATFTHTNGDPTTFFNIRLGAENLKNTYLLERSTDGGATFSPIVTNGLVPPNNIGPRSIQSGVGLGAQDYETLVQEAITTATTGEKVFCGPVDDPFFVDLGGIFDLGDAPRQGGTPCDGLACYNTHAIVLQIPISTLQKDGLGVDAAENILDGNFVIGVWASASRQQIRTLNPGGSMSFSGDWVQVSRLGMPLTNEAVLPIGAKDEWNARTPYNENPDHYEYFYNPELALYMDDDLFGGAVPAFSPLRIQRGSLPGLVLPDGFDFGNGNDGLFPLKGASALDGTALDDAVFGTLLLPAAGKPRSVDLWPAFHTGVPNVIPYQLATGKNGNPLAAGKPFINNFLPNGGDMLRLNMAVPVTPRDDANFSSLGLVWAAVLGLTDPAYATTDLEFIPNMDGFPNGRRLEDDVTRIELQAVAGVVLAAVGLWYDDFIPDETASPVTDDLLGVIGYSTGVEANDAPFKTAFPYLANPWNGNGPCGGQEVIEDDGCEVETTVVSTGGGSGSPFAFTVYEIQIDGTAPYELRWIIDGYVRYANLGDGTVLVLVGAGASFVLTTVDANGCTSITSSGVGNELLVVELIEITTESAFLASDGAIDISVVGGTGNYTYEWSNGSTTQDISGLPSGWYTVIVSDGITTIQQSYWVPVTKPGRGKFDSNETLENTLTAAPNPFSNTTRLTFSTAVSGNAILDIYSLDGKHVARLFDGTVQNGQSYEVPFTTHELMSGIYFARLIDATGTSIHQKLIIQ